MTVVVPGQPLAERVLTAAAGRQSPPQQFLLHGPRGAGKRRAARALAWALVDPDGAHDPCEESLDIATVAASGTTIRLEDELEPVLGALAAKPVVGERRVMIIDDAERLRPQEGADRILKILEEPPPLSHVVLVADSITDLTPTVRSRCMLVPFRTPGWRAIAAELAGQGVPVDEARARARADGLLALQAGPFERRLRALGAGLAMSSLEEAGPAAALVHDIQQAMESAASEHPSADLRRLRAEAAALEGRRGGKTAAKRAEDEERRHRRRLVTEGWRHVLDGMSSVYGDALAVSVAAPECVRDARLVPRLHEVVRPERLPDIEACLAEVQRARAGFRLNPLADLWIEGMLGRLAMIRRGGIPPRRSPGALPVP